MFVTGLTIPYFGGQRHNVTKHCPQQICFFAVPLQPFTAQHTAMLHMQYNNGPYTVRKRKQIASVMPYVTIANEHWVRAYFSRTYVRFTKFISVCTLTNIQYKCSVKVRSSLYKGFVGFAYSQICLAHPDIDCSLLLWLLSIWTVLFNGFLRLWVGLSPKTHKTGLPSILYLHWTALWCKDSLYETRPHRHQSIFNYYTCMWNHKKAPLTGWQVIRGIRNLVEFGCLLHLKKINLKIY